MALWLNRLLGYSDQVMRLALNVISALAHWASLSHSPLLLGSLAQWVALKHHDQSNLLALRSVWHNLPQWSVDLSHWSTCTLKARTLLEVWLEPPAALSILNLAVLWSETLFILSFWTLLLQPSALLSFQILQALFQISDSNVLLHSEYVTLWPSDQR